jgi:hypothetical protein
VYLAVKWVTGCFFLGQVFLTMFVFVENKNCFLGGFYVQLATEASVGFFYKYKQMRETRCDAHVYSSAVYLG